MFRKKNGQEFMDETNLDSSTNDKEEKKGFFHRKKKKEINLYEDDMGYIEDDSNFDEDEYDKELEELQEEEKPEKKRGFFHRKKKEEEKNTLIFAIGYEDLNTPGSRNVTKNLGKALYTNERLSSITMKKIGEKDSEDKDTPLEESFRLYRQGMELLKDLNGRLDTVEKKMLQMNEDGTFREF